MAFYENQILPRLIECACGMKAVQRERERLIPQAKGRVLEVGIGTGLNLPHYNASRIETLQGLDPACAMHAKAKQRMQTAGLAVELIPLSAEKIPSADASFDTVVCTFTLCSIPDAATALHEMRRVLAPGGRLLFCEHGRAPEQAVQKWQDRLTPIWKPIAGGCHLNRDVPAMLAAGGFKIGEMQQRYLKGPRPMTWVSSGWATA